jgi:hypothetical protein
MAGESSSFSPSENEIGRRLYGAAGVLAPPHCVNDVLIRSAGGFWVTMMPRNHQLWRR